MFLVWKQMFVHLLSDFIGLCDLIQIYYFRYLSNQNVIIKYFLHVLLCFPLKFGGDFYKQSPPVGRALSLQNKPDHTAHPANVLIRLV